MYVFKTNSAMKYIKLITYLLRVKLPYTLFFMTIKKITNFFDFKQL